MAPEQMLGHALDRRADIFAAGVMLWEAAAGSRMWQGCADATVIKRVVDGKIPSLRERNPDVSAAIVQVVEKAMAYDPANRFRTAADLEAAIEEIIASLGPRWTSREVGKFMSEKFPEKRREIGSIVESHTVDTGSGSLVPVQPQAVSKAVLRTRLAITISLVALLSVVGLSWATLSRRTEPSSGPSFTASSAPPSQAAALATVPSVPSSSSEAPPVQVRIEARPATARVYLDGRLLPHNPEIMTQPRDRSEHEVRAEAPGFIAQKTTLTLDGDKTLTMALEPAPKSTSANGRAAPLPAASKAADTRPKVDCTELFYVDERGIKTIRPECR
jgi:serine/threonine-protein kinase